MERRLSTLKLGRRQFLQWTAMTGAGAVLAACQPAVAPASQAGQEDTAAPSTEAMVVQWWNGDPIDYQDVYQQMATAFNQQRSDIQIEVENIPGAFDERLNAMFAANQGPDTWMGFYAVEFARRGALENLDAYLESSSINPEEIWFQICGRRAMWEGSRYGVPRDVGFAGLVYNQDLFDEFGVSYPTEGWTVDDFVTTCQAIRNEEKGTWGTTFSRAGALAWDSGPLPWNLGFQMTSPDGRQVQGFWDTPESIEAIQWYIDLEAEYDVAVTSDAAQALGGGGMMAFNSAKVALGQSSTWELDIIRELPFKWGYAPYPVKDRGGRSFAWSDSVQYYMWSGAQNKPEIWEVMAFISGPEGTTIAQKTGKWASPCPAVWEELGLNTDPMTSHFYAMKDLETPIPNYLISEHQWTCIQPNLADVFTRYIEEKEQPLEPVVVDQAAVAQTCLDDAYAAG